MKTRKLSRLAVAGAAAAVVMLVPPANTAYAQCMDDEMLVQQQKLTASDVAADASFGFSISVSGETAVVGAPGIIPSGSIECGSAYVYRFNGTDWVEDQKLTASDAVVDDRFGLSVSVSGETAVVGAFGDDCATGVNCGSAYVFRFNGTYWVEEQKLTASDATGGRMYSMVISLGFPSR